MDHSPLRLKKQQERRLGAGHCWVYSNEVDAAATPLKGFEPGQPVDIISHQGKWLGSGYVNPHSLICARLVSRDRAHPLSGSLLVHRLKIALGLRQRLYPRPFYRLVFGESDGLPGLVVDRYGEVAVVQVTTAGMERMKGEIVQALEKVIRPRTVLFRNDTPVRETEGLERYVEMRGEPLGEWLEVEENSLSFRVPASEGQKTGWFFDQAGNRARLAPYVRGRRVLEVCSYVGAWGVTAATHGARVLSLDVSAPALRAVELNAQRNGVGDAVSTLRGDAFDALRELRAAGERYDVLMVDPPAFIKRRKDLKQGTLAYRRLNQLALQLLEREGVLITSSCSHHMSRDALLDVLQQAARHTGRQLQLLEQGHQAADHPVHPAIPETAYLKTFFLRVLPAF
ncbi:MAG: rRNA large subunit methyltransferase I [Candidatus Sedimenticola endophacoides]|uniref:RlmI/RlmK family 23S rRNA methyltransferase n=1 Tax=Candidatus Sedimenticola endophacoides TaxID=2548426 RepID=A0A657PX88_9GAMM|nr:MAG: rRNA large subunit methyltransferase I [Candidatus Sedimenticola endophacoides]OQX33071.1 MAG: rRNA large subunit methyltransferase I [Candidatus Sedimenticola endophacoides]OQX33828.1 MAG: rRNA large subunit methyltransferase I [Candidatus Sedimenticola endophacoides]OQX39559.1 MAG: rRNA large subunit methyltransferase I [Candidatus Sedimenticola endophacoides]OQX44704.1 MAG: rRNA large subunit methyltransferase I [Candidatus Sedimenticola endophacoides]